MKYPNPVSVSEYFSADDIVRLKFYIRDQVAYLRAKTQGLREELLPKWIKVYKGIPETEKVEFPWPGASNLVISSAATHADELLARVMSIYSLEQLFACQIYGDFGDGEGEDERSALEYFLSDVALEPTELNLYPVEETWFSSAIRYGTGIIYMPWEVVTEKQFVYMGGLSSEGQRFRFDNVTTKEGPAPENIPLNKFGTDPQIASLPNSNCIYLIDTMHWDRLKQWKNKEVYDFIDQDALERVIQSPDRNMPDFTQMTEEEILKMETSMGSQSYEWDIYRLFMRWDKDGVGNYPEMRSEDARTDNAKAGTYSLLAFYHYGTETYLGCIFNPYPENLLPIEDAKLAYDDSTYYGYGFMEMLEMYQREISINHNHRINNRNLTNTGMGRINPTSKLASILKIYPGALIPAAKDEVEPLAFGAPNANLSTEDEQLTMQYMAARAGVDPSIGGSGGGTVNAKRGNYSSGGTAIVQQQRDNRNNLRMSDMRSAHARLGRKAATLYSYFGINSKAQRYGDKADVILQALKNFRDKKLGLMIRPVTASVNREMEKQNDILLSQTLGQAQQMDMQLMQALMQQGAPPELKSYIADVMYGKNHLLRQLLMAFNKRDVELLAPIPDVVKQVRDAAREQRKRSVQKPMAPAQQAQGVLPGADRRPTSSLPQGAARGGVGQLGLPATNSGLPQ